MAQKYLVIYTFGNHDAFDWNDSRLFLNQMKILSRAGVQLIVANAFFGSKYEALFRPYVDVYLSKNKSIRFAGHDHSHIFDKEKETDIIDSGSHFEFSTVLLNNNGKVRSKFFFDHDA